MPVTYEPPATLLAPRAASSVGGGGSNFSAMYAAELAAKTRTAELNAELMQRNIMGQEAANVQARQFAASRDISPRDVGLAQLQMAEARQRFQLQAELNQAELSQAENMRLQRLKQAEAGVRTQYEAGQITNEEAGAMMTQLRTSINPLEQRKAATQQKKIEQDNKIADYMFQRQVDRDAAATKLQSQRFEDRWAVFVDPQDQEQIASELEQTLPQFSAMPNEAKASIVKKIAIQRGLYQMGFQSAPGKWDMHPPRGRAAADAAAKNQKPGDEPHPDYNATRGEYTRAAQTAEKNARRDLTLTTGEGPDKKLVHPVPVEKQDEWIRGRIDQEIARTFGRRSNGKPTPPPSQWKPFEPNNPHSGNEGQRLRVQQIDRELAAVQNRDDLPTDVKLKAMEALQTGRQLFAKYGSYEAMPDKAKQKFDEAANLVGAIPPAPQAPQQPNQPPHVPQTPYGDDPGTFSQ